MSTVTFIQKWGPTALVVALLIGTRNCIILLTYYDDSVENPSFCYEAFSS